VIGVAPRSFEGAIGGPVATKIWIPLSVETLVASPPSVGVGSQPERRPLLVFGRLASAVTVDMATAEIKGIAANLDAVSPLPTRSVRVRPEQRPWTAKSIAEIAEQDDAMRRFGLTLVALVALVLVVACTNLSNLVLARGTLRQQDFTVRYALGASRWRLVREQCAESLLLAIAGGLASYVVFHGLSRLIDLELHFPLPGGGRWTWSIQPSLDMTALLVAGTSLLLALVVFGLEPALQLTRPRDLRGRLAEGSGGTANPRLQRQRVLIRWQVAIAAGFFVIATMFIKYTIAEMRHDPGLDLDRLALGFLNLKTPEWDEARVRRTLDRVAQEVGQDPAIESVSVSTGMPFGSPSVFRLSLATPETMNQDPRYHHAATGIGATPSIFRTLGVPIVHGRGFDDRDQQGSAPVVVMSAFTARALFGTSDAVGRQLMVRTQSSRGLVTIIGVARDTDVGGLMREPRAFIYLPFTQHYDPSLIVAVRSTGDQAAAMRALRDALHRADPDLAVDAIGPSRSLLAAPFVLLRAVGVGTVSLGLLTLLVAMGGLFALQSHAVIRRTREIGLRMSFGANDVQIKRMVLQDGYRPVLEGLALGVFMGLAGRVLMRRYLEIDVAVIDPWMLFGVPLPLILAAFFACYFPARRAAAVAPSVALRHL
jgi:predicted permease